MAPLNPGVESMMKLGALAMRLGRRFAPPEQRAEMRGVSGALNFDFTGPDGGGWHIDFSDGTVTMRKGLHESPRATVRLTPESYLALIGGDLSPSVARMTGKVRVAGDGNFGMIFNAMVGSLQNAQMDGGLRGWLTRRLVARALRRGGYDRKRKSG